MINKIIAFLILPCMILALVLSFVGVQQVTFDNSYYNFMSSVNNTFNSWSFSIPEIPKIPNIKNANWEDVYELFTFLKFLGGVIVKFLNGLISVINILIMIINVIIHLLQFILSIIYCVLNFRDTMATNSIILGLNSL